MKACACATCYYHDGETCHLYPHREKTSKFYWCKEWALDVDKTCGELKEEKMKPDGFTGKQYTACSRCHLIVGHGGEHEFSFWRLKRDG